MAIGPDGNALWGGAYGTGGAARATAVAANRCADELFLTGTFQGAMSFERPDDAGAIVLQAVGDATPPVSQLFVARLTP
jgi:hypothetical protein